jgi:hypothetical protein
MAANAAQVNLRDVVLPLCGISNVGAMAVRQTTLFIALHQIHTIDEFDLLEPHQAKDLVKTFNSRNPNISMGILVMNNLTGLIWYVKDKVRRNLPIDPLALNINDLKHGHLAYEAYTSNRDKGDNIKSLEKWSDRVDFDEWDRKVTETLSLIYGRYYCPIAYVIRPDKPAGWDPLVDATTDYERLMYQLELAGPAFEQDNELVFSLIQLAVVQTAAETWIFDAVAGRDGRQAMSALRAHYEGEAELDVRADHARRELRDLAYSDERTMTFETMITRLNKAYNVLKKQGQEYTDRSKVEALAQRIKNPTGNVAISVAVEQMRTLFKDNYVGAVQHISPRMAQLSSANVPTGRRRVSENNATQQQRTEWNGVDIRNPFRNFTDLEKERLGTRGLQLVEDLKALSRERNGGRGRGRGGGRGRNGGRGRGGRFQWNRRNHGNSNNTNNSGGTDGNRNVNESNTGGRAGQAPGTSSSSSVSSVTQSQASTSTERGAQNGSRFGGTRA